MSGPAVGRSGRGAGLQGVRLVAAREITESFRSKTFRIILAVLAVVAAALVVVPRVLDSGEQAVELGVVGEVPEGFVQAVAAGLDQPGTEDDPVTFTATSLATREAARAAVDAGDVELAVVPPPADAGAGAAPEVLVREGSDPLVVATVEQVLVAQEVRDRLAAAGLDDAGASEVLAVPGPERTTVDRASDDTQRRKAVAFALGLVLYLALLVGGQAVAAGVAQEKTTRVAEILLATLRPRELLAGKVLGLGVVLLVQLSVLVVPVAVSSAIGGGGAIDLPPATALDLLAGVGWFLLGYVLYAVAYAAVGSLVERDTEVNTVVIPLTLLLVAAYFIALQGQTSPDGGLVVVGSYFPFTAPIVMPTRVAAGAVGPVEVLVSVGLCVVAAVVAMRVGAVVYARALMRTGRRVRLREVLRA